MEDRIVDGMFFLVMMFFLPPGLVWLGVTMRRSVEKDTERSGLVSGQTVNASQKDAGRWGVVNRSKAARGALLSADKQLLCENKSPVALGPICGDYVNFAVRSHLYEVIASEEHLEVYSHGNSARGS